MRHERDFDELAPQVDFTPAVDPHVAQLRRQIDEAAQEYATLTLENERLRARVATLERRLLLHSETIERITETVNQVRGVKGTVG